MDKLEQAYLSVSCPLCKAAPRRPCTMPNGQPYYRRAANRKKLRAFHERRQKRALVIYSLHATQHAEEVESQREVRKLKRHPRVHAAETVEGGAHVIHVDFQSHKKGA